MSIVSTKFPIDRSAYPAYGYHEWRREVKRKVLMPIVMKESPAIHLRGIVEYVAAPEGNDLCTFTIISINANELLHSIHHRMPVIIAAWQHRNGLIR